MEQTVVTGRAGLTLAIFATPLAAKNRFVKASFGGFAGSGKSRTGSEFCAGAYKDMGLKKPVLILDNEKGARFLEPFFKKQQIPTFLKETTALSDLLDAMTLLQRGEVDFLFVDSLSKIWYQYVRDYKAANGNIKFMSLEHWGKILPAWQETFSDRFVEAQGNIVFTGRGGFTYDMEEQEKEDGSTKKQFIKSGVKMKLAGETPFEPDINVWMQLAQKIIKGKMVQSREAQILKDRSSLIDGKTFINPKYENFRPVVKFLMEVPVGDVAGPGSGHNLAPSEDHRWVQRKQEREIEVEKIQGAFQLAALGTSKEDKQIRNEILQKFVGTLSSKELEKMASEQLRIARINIERLLKDWAKIATPDRLPYVRNFKLLTEEPIGVPLFDDAAEEATAEPEQDPHSPKYGQLLEAGRTAKTTQATEKVSREAAGLYGTGDLTTDEYDEISLVCSNRREELKKEAA